MKISSSPTPAPNSSVCDACRGLFDLSNPRGFVIDRHGESHHNGAQSHPQDCESRCRYTYTYIHHKTILDLLSSSLAGCGICGVFCGSLRLKETERISELLPGSPPASKDGSPTQSTSGADAVSEVFNLEETPDKCDPDNAESEEADMDDNELDNDKVDEDDWEPAQLANFVKHKAGLCSNTDILNHCNRRVVILHDFDELAGLERASLIDARSSGVYCEALEEIDDWHDGDFHHFTTPFDPTDPDWKHRPTNDLLSNCHIGLINRWRTACDREHKSCQKTSHEQLLPTRILEILDSVENNERVRLVETKGSKQGIYACLSYCWGDLQIQAGRTTRRNLSRHLEGIPLHDLPRTVIDAIRLCSKLGYRYLWVDRLCIVQDDREDWLLEASRMCKVYSRSALTIAVSICEDTSQSFLAERGKGFREQRQFATLAEPNSNKTMRWFSIKWPKHELKEGPWFLEDRWESLQTFEGPFWKEGARKNNWLGRSWTFQEWMLSPRVLHIDSMTLWDCFDGYANELNCRNMVSARLLRDSSRLGQDISWESIVQEYSSRKITHEEDRLPALAGLAERYAHVTGKTYLAGLWLEDFPRSLLWLQRSTNLPPQVWCDSLQTPSWSWASLKRPVWYPPLSNRFHYRHFTKMASIRSTSCQYQPPGSFARVEEAWIDMICPISPVTKRHDDKVLYRMHTVYAGGKKWIAAAENDFVHGDSDRNDVANVYLLLLGQARSSRMYGALIAKRFKCDDGRFYFRRLGVATYSPHMDVDALDIESQWEEQVIRLV